MVTRKGNLSFDTGAQRVNFLDGGQLYLDDVVVIIYIYYKYKHLIKTLKSIIRFIPA